VWRRTQKNAVQLWQDFVDGDFRPSLHGRQSIAGYHPCRVCVPNEVKREKFVSWWLSDVIPHACDPHVCSTDIREVLLRLSREMVEFFGLTWDEEGLEEYQAVKERVSNFLGSPIRLTRPRSASSCQLQFLFILQEAGEAARRMKTFALFVIDGVNQLSPFNGAHSLDWLPTYMPAGVKMVLSMVAGYRQPCVYYEARPATSHD